MDSGLGSDEERKGRTKEQKQLRNQQLSGCFIDAASLSDESDFDHRRNDERRQGALVFQSSIPQYSMLQMSGSDPEDRERSSAASSVHDHPSFDNTSCSTPYNSIAHVEEERVRRPPALGFYVDLNDVPEPSKPKTPSNSTKKNIFSMVIDFEDAKKDKPSSLSSSYLSCKKGKPLNGLSASLNAKRSGSLSGSSSSINSVAGPSKETNNHNGTVNSYDICKNNGSSSSSSLSNAEGVIAVERKKSVDRRISVEELKDEKTIVEEKDRDEATNEKYRNEVAKYHITKVSPSENSSKGILEKRSSYENKKSADQNEEKSQFVRLSDLECQKTKLDINFAPRMSRSIPESSWVESPLLMSRSAGYRSAPHPMEPDEDDEEMYDSFTLSDTTISQPRKSVQRLGTDLLRMFLEEIGPDVTVEVEGHKIKAHKCILTSRCQYFAAVISGDWLERHGNVITLQGFSYEAVYFALCHIYSGAAHIPDSISIIELASLADMLSLEGLKEVVEHALKQRYCHSFHKPCPGCCSGVLEVLVLSAAYGLDDLYQRSLQWIKQHFVKVWPCRAFATLPRELRDKCYQQHVVNMTPDGVLDTISSCEKLLANLPKVRWSETIHQLIVQLIDACHLYHRQHFAAVLGAPSFIALDSGPAWSVNVIEDQMFTAAKNLGIEQACRSYTRCCRMLGQKIRTKEFAELLGKIKTQLEQCLIAQADRLIRSNAWLRLDSVLRARIKELVPLNEPVSRLPRSTQAKSRYLQTSTSNTKPPIASSSDSSRNSSPCIGPNRRNVANEASQSLRRSLLLAAKAPQVPPSPSAQRKSTLSQPTAASKARAAIVSNSANKHVRSASQSKVEGSTRGTVKNKAMSRSENISKSSSRTTIRTELSLRKNNTRTNIAPTSSSNKAVPFRTDVNQGSSTYRKITQDTPSNTIIRKNTRPVNGIAFGLSGNRKTLNNKESLNPKEPLSNKSSPKLAPKLAKSPSMTKKLPLSISNKSTPNLPPPVIKSQTNSTKSSPQFKSRKPLTSNLSVKSKTIPDRSKSPSSVISKTSNHSNKSDLNSDLNQTFVKQHSDDFTTSSEADTLSDGSAKLKSDTESSDSESKVSLKRIPPAMQRSSTFNLDEPTILGKILN